VPLTFEVILSICSNILYFNFSMKNIREILLRNSDFNYIAIMKMLKNNSWKKLLFIFGGFFLFLIVIDYIILPIYVSGRELKVPDVVGKQKDEAKKILEDSGLTPIFQTTRFDPKYPKDHVVFQKPLPSSIVKTNRRIYLTISGGDQLIKVPSLIGKTIRDAQVSLERLGFSIGKIDSVESEFPVNTIVEQQYFEGRELAQGTSINIKVSIGPQIGMIRVPNLITKSLGEAENILKSNNLKIGYKTYIHAPSLLPNTIMSQDPSEGTLLKIGDSVNVEVSQSKLGNRK
jgi:eukaryotic-like serine/threonine-protein kinase